MRISIHGCHRVCSQATPHEEVGSLEGLGFAQLVAFWRWVMSPYWIGFERLANKWKSWRALNVWCIQRWMRCMPMSDKKISMDMHCCWSIGENIHQLHYWRPERSDRTKALGWHWRSIRGKSSNRLLATVWTLYPRGRPYSIQSWNVHSRGLQ